MPKNLTPSQFYKDDFKKCVLDHLVHSLYLRDYHENDAYVAVRDLLSIEHMISLDPNVCPEAKDLLWTAPEGWKLVPLEVGQLSETVPIECIMQEDQSAEYDWIYTSNLERAGL